MLRSAAMRTMILKAAVTASLAALLLSLSAVAVGQVRDEINVASLGPQLGESVPAFNLQDQNGQYQILDSIAGPNGTMLLFHRSADW